jgi:hypothetical protein
MERAYAIAIAFSHFGLGLEQIPVADGQLTRYSIGSGLAISQHLFLGLRHRFFRGDSASLSGFSSLDVGVQYRPAQWLSIGALATGLNTPQVLGLRSDILKAIGTTVRLHDSIDLSLDYGERSLGEWRYFGKISLKPLRGLSFELGHHEEHGLQLGLQWTIGSANFFGYTEPDHQTRPALFGFDLSSIPYERSVGIDSTLNVAVDDSLSETGAKGTLLAPARPSFIELLRRIENAADHRKVSDIVLRLKSFPLGLSSAWEFGEALQEVRKKGKQVTVYLGQASLREYLIASAADKIFVEPGGEIRLTGLSVQRYYLKGTLDKIGLEGEFLAKGEFKSAPEMFTRKDSSPSARKAAMEELRRAEQLIEKRLVQSGRIKRANME